MRRLPVRHQGRDARARASPGSTSPRRSCVTAGPRWRRRAFGSPSCRPTVSGSRSRMSASTWSSAITASWGSPIRADGAGGGARAAPGRPVRLQRHDAVDVGGLGRRRGSRPRGRCGCDYFGLRRADHDDPDWSTTEFQLTYGDWIRLFRANRLQVEDLIELRPDADAATTYDDYAPLAWARAFPAEHIWKVRKAADAGG